jgi:hypothetical protein
MRHDTTPLVVAVTYPQHGHTWPGRVSEWEQRDGAWWGRAHGEYGNYKAGSDGGWIPADQLEPADHTVTTTFTPGHWYVWEEQPWPAGLERFAAASNNLNERDRAERKRPHPG